MRTPSPLDRRAFLKLAALSALARYAPGFAANPGRDLVVVSNAGGGGSVSLIDPGTLRLLKTLPLEPFAFPATRWHFTRDLIWSGLPAGPNNAVRAFQLSSGARVLEVPTGSSQNYTELTPDGRFVIVAARFVDRFLKIAADPTAPEFGRVVAAFDTYAGAQPCDITVEPNGAYAFAPDRGGETVSVLRLEPFQRVARLALRPLRGAPRVEPFMATVSPRGDLLFVENATENSEAILDVREPERPVEVMRLFQADGLGDGPITSEFTPDGRFGLVICRNSDEVSVVDTATLAVAARVRFPERSRPLTGAFTPAGDRFFVPLPGRDAVAVVRVPAFEVEELIPVGPRPTGVVYLRTPLPARAGLDLRHGAALAAGREFAPGCPDRCCGPL